MVVDVLTVDIAQNDTTICEGDSLVLSVGVSGMSQIGSGYDTLSLGDSFQGGLIFYLDGNGGGLVVTSTELSDPSGGWYTVPWHSGTDVVTNASGDGLYAGKINTELIIAALGVDPTIMYAARFCDEYSVISNGINYDDWYLPSKYELDLIWTNLGANNLGSFTT